MKTLKLQMVFDLCIWLGIPFVRLCKDFYEVYSYFWMAVYIQNILYHQGS